MRPTITFYGVAAYKITTSSGKAVVIDPFFKKNPVSPIKAEDLDRVDLLLITHNAVDHFGDAPAIIRKHHCPVICAKDVMHNLTSVYKIDPDLFRVTIWGMEIEEAGTRVRPVESHHWSFSVTPEGQLLSGPAMGFIVQASEDVRIYHPGDTAITYDMKLWGELYRPTVGLMHVTLPEGEGVSLPHQELYRSGELTPYEAWLASQWLQLEHVIISHYTDPGCVDVQHFLELVKSTASSGTFSPKITLLEPGVEFEL
jgi:L-ascorbate metabolism protein UlaG (beta-lactamase superfamily)